MIETSFEVSLPQTLLGFGLDQDDIQNRIVEWMVLYLFTTEGISSGKAARLLNISRIDFLALLRQYNIAYIDYTPEELAEEFAAVERLNVTLEQ